MTRTLPAAALASALGLLSGAPRAQAQAEPVTLCTAGIPEALVPEMRLELVARGHRVAVACAAPEGWLVGIEAPSLAEVWVVARRDGRTRRSRVPRSLDAVDGRALGIAAATLLGEEDPTAPRVDGDPTATSVEGSEGGSEPGTRDPHAAATRAGVGSGDPDVESEPETDPEPDPDPEPDLEPEPEELVISSRALTPDMVVFVGAAGVVGRLVERHGGLGGLFAIGRHLLASVRLDAGAALSGWKERVLLGAWVGLTRVWRPVTRTWVEVGGALRYAQDIAFGGGARIGVGPEAHVALQRKPGVGGRFFCRLSGAPLIYLHEDPTFGAEGVLSLGWVITP